MLGNLYIVATPIGNLEDITFRAVRTLKEVDFIYAEDTRTTGNLLKKYDITWDKPKLFSYNAVNHKQKNVEIIKHLEEGKSVALVSDAGTPGVSDPGYSLVSEVRKHFKEAQGDVVKIIPIPGASALTAFISVLGLGTHAWTFYGFLPHKNGRQKLLKEILESEKSSCFYESTHRIEKCMQELVKLGCTRQVALGRELTKIYEEVLVGTPQEVLEIFKKYPERKKGEFVVMVI